VGDQGFPTQKPQDKTKAAEEFSKECSAALVFLLRILRSEKRLVRPPQTKRRTKTQEP
jgi:hypothetical protein